jgi:hypothetical protein
MKGQTDRSSSLTETTAAVGTGAGARRVRVMNVFIGQLKGYAIKY